MSEKFVGENSFSEHFHIEHAVRSSERLAVMRNEEIRDNSNHPRYRISENSSEFSEYADIILELKNILSDRLGGVDVPLEDVMKIYKVIVATHVKLSREVVEDVVDELFAIENLFASNGIALSLTELYKTITYNGYEYWEDFFYSDEFKPFRGRGEGYVKSAISRNIDTRGLLSSSLKMAAELEKDPEFECFKLSPFSYFHASFYYINGAKDFLRRVIKEVDAILGEEEFGHFSDRKGFVISTVVSSINNARKKLRAYNPSRVVLGAYANSFVDPDLGEEVEDLVIDVRDGLGEAMKSLGDCVVQFRELSNLKPTAEVRAELDALRKRLNNFVTPLE